MYQDTIAAIATPPGAGAIGVVRVSGAQALGVVQGVFSARLLPRRVAAGRLIDPYDGRQVDEVMAVYLPGPRSYTGEDVVEVSCHGGMLPVQQTLALLLRQGARSADPGEFTLRAYLSGRIDLAQAEAVMDVVSAQSARALHTALGGLRGDLSQRIQAVRSQLLDVLAYLTANADFPEEGIAGEHVVASLTEALRTLSSLAATAREGTALREGVRTAIVGLPNAGKSSLLNRLLGRDRAIVSSVPGTTRDTLSETAVAEGIPFLLTDTAGMGETSDPIEALGVERALAEAQEAELLLFVVDGAGPVTPATLALGARLPATPAVLILNKRDLPGPVGASTWAAAMTREFISVVEVSALTGIHHLQHAMAAVVQRPTGDAAAGPLVTNPRHAAAIERAHASVAAAIATLEASTPPDLAAIDLTGAVNALGQITGETASTDLLDRIFSRFCIGK